MSWRYTYRSARRDGWTRRTSGRKFLREIWRGITHPPEIWRGITHPPAR